MTNLEVSPDYLTSLSNRMGTWVGETLEPAMAAVPNEWTTDGTLVASAAGSALLGAAGGGIVNFNGLKGGYDDLMKQDFKVKGFSFKGAEAYQAAWIVADLYSIYSKLKSGDHWGAALAAIGIIPRFSSILAERDGIKDLLKSSGGTTDILDYTGYALTGIGLCFGIGITDTGEDFTAGANKFADGGAALRQLMPESEWSGDASTGYGESVEQLQKLMTDMAAADAQMADILRSEEEQLQLTRNIITTAKKAVAYAVPAAITIYLSPALGGPAASQVFQTSVSVGVFATAVGAVGSQLNLSYRNGAQVHSQQQLYGRVQNEAERLLQRLSA
jgi:uncharacterized protein YukE